MSVKAPLVIFALAATLGACSSGAAQSYPARPITIVVPFSPGGPTDTLARILGERMRKILAQTVLVYNTPGAGGSIGTGMVVRSAPDGHIVGIGHWGTHVVNGAYYSLPFNLLTDLEPVAMIASSPLIIISKTAVPAENLKELIAWISANQDKVLMGAGSAGSASHMAAIYFGNMIGVKFHIVAYRGGAPALQALLVGEIDLYVPQISNVAGHVKAGKIRAYAVTASTRLAVVPEVPTVDEAGLPGLHISTWHGIWLPRGTPREVVMKLNAAIVQTLADPAVQQRFADLGQEIPAREQQTPEALFAHHKAEIDKWWPIIKAAGLKAE
jgi:tripartite-type tricarboxylate transporter receptor subunit TctC